MTEYTRIDTLPEKKITYATCKGCKNFRIGIIQYLFGFGTARCASEGRIIEHAYSVAPICWNRVVIEGVYLIPHWCPIREGR